MSFLDYLKEHRGQFIDHRATPPSRPGTTALEAEADLEQEPTIGGGGAAGASSGTMRRRRRTRSATQGTRFRHVRPVFAPSPYSDPLPYEEPWERAFR